MKILAIWITKGLFIFVIYIAEWNVCSNLSTKMTFHEKNDEKDFNDLLNKTKSGEIYITTINTNNIKELKGMPPNAYGYGLMLTIGSDIFFLKLQLYIEESAANVGSRIYYRTRCDVSNWRKIMSQQI